MRRGHSLDTVLTLVLFALFSCCLLMVLILGAQSYQRVVTASQESYEERTCLQYIATKVNHYSGKDAVTVTAFGDGSALALRETIDGYNYITYLYLHDGNVKELFCEADVDLSPEAGFSIMEIEHFSVEEISSNLLRLSCTGSGGTAQLYVGCHSGEGVTP